MLGIGPVFVALLLWPATSKFFDSWFGQVMTYILRIALVAAVMGLAFKGFDAVINSVDLDSDQKHAIHVPGADYLHVGYVLAPGRSKQRRRPARGWHQ